MERTDKQQAALDRLLERYASGVAYEKQEKSTPSMRRARLASARRYRKLRDRLEIDGKYSPLKCTCKIDRIIYITDQLDTDKILRMRGYRKRADTPRWLWNKSYQWVWQITGTSSIREVSIEFEPAAPWFAPFQVTIIPRNSSGVDRRDLDNILALIPNARLSLLEFSLDFPPDSIIDLEYVLRHGIFGKTHWTASHTGNPFHSKHGSLISKIVRAYMKWETGQFRIELQLHISFLRKNGISGTSDFSRLAGTLFPGHVIFRQIDEAKLVRTLGHTSLTEEERNAVFKRATGIAGERLNDALKYLRGGPANLQNTSRFMVDIQETNEVVRRAAETWANKWAKEHL